MNLYRSSLLIFNIVVFLSSAISFFFFSLLINFYVLPSLKIVSNYFQIVPNLILSIGTLELTASIIGFFIIVRKSRVLLSLYILFLLVFVVPCQIATTFTTWHLRNMIILGWSFQVVRIIDGMIT